MEYKALPTSKAKGRWRRGWSRLARELLERGLAASYLGERGLGGHHRPPPPRKCHDGANDFHLIIVRQAIVERQAEEAFPYPFRHGAVAAPHAESHPCRREMQGGGMEKTLDTPG